MTKMADRRFFVGGNWKMNGDKAGIDDIVKFLDDGPLDSNTGITIHFSCSIQFGFFSTGFFFFF